MTDLQPALLGRSSPISTAALHGLVTVGGPDAGSGGNMHRHAIVDELLDELGR